MRDNYPPGVTGAEDYFYPPEHDGPTLKEVEEMSGKVELLLEFLPEAIELVDQYGGGYTADQRETLKNSIEYIDEWVFDELDAMYTDIRNEEM